MRLPHAMLSERELAVLLAPEESSWLVKVEETPERLVARPGRFSLVWSVISLVIPHIVLVWYFWEKANQAAGLDDIHWYAIAMMCVEAPFMVGLLWWLNRANLKGAFFLLDKTHKMLTLSRLGIELDAHQVSAFIEVHARHGAAP